mmetsp:Transcript_3335/g.7794  ORF Transcript_3335/g.7794 Transcript_3335/m.7794 type:complete len:725 (+) Transcript_3335:90-2264(+)
MLPRFSYPNYQNMMGLAVPQAMGQSAAPALPMANPYLASQGPVLPMSHMEMASALDSCKARAQAAEAQVAQLMQIMELSQSKEAHDPMGVPAMHHRPSSASMPEAQLPQRSLQQALGVTFPQTRERSPLGVEGSPSSDMSKPIEYMDQEMLRLRTKLKPKQTLRGYLEELRSEDPRCIFIVRRINKLGFRSKSMLESHYARYGKVLQVCVAHSKVKPLPNSGQTARTRPGNFGLVVMQDPASVQKVLDKGPIHAVDGVEISVQKYQPNRLEEVSLGEEEQLNEGPKTESKRKVRQKDFANRQAQEETSGSTQTGSSEGSNRSINGGDVVDDWNRQESGSSNVSSLAASYGSASSAQAESLAKMRAGMVQSEQPEPSNEWRAPMWEASQAAQAEDQTFLVSLSARELHELQQMLQPRAARTENELVDILECLQNMANDSHKMQGCSREQMLEAAGLVSSFKRQLSSLYTECKAKLADINATAAAAAAPMPQLDLATLMGLNGMPGLPPTSVGALPPTVGALPSVQAQAMAILQAQQHLNLLQAQLGAGLSSWMNTAPGAPCPAPSEPSASHMLRHPQEEAAEGVSEQNEALRSCLKELNGEDPNCIFIARHIGGLGFQAQEALWHHYTKFGKVKKVLVSPKAKARSRGLRNRPVPLGVVVMETAGGVRKILAQGEEQLVNGHLIKVQGFEKPGKARAKGTARSKANAVSEDGSSGDQVAEGSWEF